VGRKPVRSGKEEKGLYKLDTVRARLRTLFLSQSGKRLLQRLEIDRAVISVASYRGWQVIAGPLTVFFIVRFLSPEQQGFYYTFLSLLMAQGFFELGLSFVLGISASHEFIHLRWAKKGAVEGDPLALRRFSDLLFKSGAWYAIAALLLTAILIPTGLLFFGHKDVGAAMFEWRWPWVLLVLSASLNLWLMPLFAVLEGCGEVAKVNAVRLLQGISSSIVGWAALGVGAGLYAASASMLCMFVVGISWLVYDKPKMLPQLLFRQQGLAHGETHCGGLSWRQEIWPMQWRFGVTVISSFFIYQLVTPVLFYYQGSVVAGQMGMTMGMVNALYFVALAWIASRVPTFGALVARKDWKGLDSLFARVFKVAFAVIIAGACASLVAIWLIQQHWLAMGDRFLPSFEVALLLVATVIDLVINAMAAYLRAHRQEPLMYQSVGAAILRGSAIWLLGMYFSSLGVVVGILAVNLLYGLPSSTWIWLKLRREWHQVSPAG